jgi:predicted dehydrogenase
MRFGVVGTSFWAREVHTAGITAAEEAELVGVWGRDPAKTRDLAVSVGVTAYDDFEALLADVDAVSFSVPPHVQAELARTAASACRHLLLEKPIATTLAKADELVAAISDAGVSSVVFLTSCYTPERRQWAERMQQDGPWRGADAIWLASAFAEGSPFDTPWRHEKGALWDVGPHILAALTDGLGPITEVLAAARGAEDLIHVVLRHDSGATSTFTATLSAPRAVARQNLRVWGDREFVEMPHSSQPPSATFATAVGELVRSAETGEQHRLSAAFGRDLVALLARAEALAGPSLVV